MPSNAARPDRRRLLRVAGAGLAGLALGVGAALAGHGLGGRSEPAASVQRLDLPAGTPAAGVGPAGAVAADGPAPAPPVGAGTARAAVRRFLQAGADGDLEVAYRLLDDAGRRRYPSLARFTRAQADQARVTGVRVGAERRAGAGTANVTVTLTHPAAIDPFAGLVPARTVEVWRASRQDGRWWVAADPLSARADLPGDDRAPEAVSAWVERLLDCDRAGAAGLQAAADLYGPADLAERPCTERGRWTVAAPEGFDAAVEPEAYVAAFGPEVGAWARLVPVQGPRTRFSVVVGPLGDAWRVLGTDPVTPR
ncbi:MAG TPA: hypothetical protein VFX88_23360 [Actinomycetota bacterium]|nr:hypothetical protein [Actinomycetota bacterium]